MVQLRPVRLAFSGLLAVACVFALSATTALARSSKISAADAALTAYAGHQLGRERRRRRERPLLDAHADQQVQRRLAGPGLVKQPQPLSTTTTAGNNSSAAGLRRRRRSRPTASCTSRPHQRRVCDERNHRSVALELGSALRDLGSGVPASAQAAASLASRWARGKVFVSLADGSLVALDQATGAVLLEDNHGALAEGRPPVLCAALLQRHGLRADERWRRWRYQRSGLRLTQPLTARSSGAGASFRRPSQPGSKTWSTLNGGAYTRQRVWRRRPVADACDRREGQCADHRHRQPGAVELTRSGEEPLHGLDRRAGLPDRRVEVVLPDGPSRPLGLGPAEQPDRLQHEDDLPKTVKNKKGKKVTKKVLQKVTAVADVAKYGWTWMLNAKHRQAAQQGRPGQGASGHGARREHVADPADSADAEHAGLQQRRRIPAHEERSGTCVLEPELLEQRLQPTRTNNPTAHSRRASDRVRLRFPALRHDPVGGDAVREHGLAVQLLRPADARVHHLRRHWPRVRPRADSGSLGDDPAGRRNRCGRPEPRRQHSGHQHAAPSRRSTC